MKVRFFLFCLALIMLAGCSPSLEEYWQSFPKNTESWSEIASPSPENAPPAHQNGAEEDWELIDQNEDKRGGWSLRGEEIESGYKYMLVFWRSPNFEWKWRLNPITMKFFSPERITKEDLLQNVLSDYLQIPRLDLSAISSSVTRKYDFGIRCLWSYFKDERKENMPSTIIFPPGSGEKVFHVPHKELSDQTFPYINYLSEPVWLSNSSLFPEYAGWYAGRPGRAGKDNCVIVMGRAAHFSDLPFKLSGGFADATLAFIEEQNATSKCREMLWHEHMLEFYNDETVCILWFEKNTSLREISS